MDDDWFYDSEEEIDNINYPNISRINKRSERRESEKDIQRDYQKYHTDIGGYERLSTHDEFNQKIFNTFVHDSPINHGYFPNINRATIAFLNNYGLLVVHSDNPEVKFLRYFKDVTWDIQTIRSKTDGVNIFTHRLFIRDFSKRYPNSKYKNIFIDVTYLRRDIIVSDISYMDETVTRYSDISSVKGERSYSCSIKAVIKDRKKRTITDYYPTQDEINALIDDY